MAVEAICDHCGKRFGVEDSYAGTTVRCPLCRGAVPVPKGPPDPPGPVRAPAGDPPGVAPARPVLQVTRPPVPPGEPESYAVVVLFAWLYLAATGLWLLVSVLTSGEKTGPDLLRSLGPALGGFFTACLFAPWSFLAVDAARTLRAILQELRERGRADDRN
jgi:DNA-directed RNA polymerase subunit RPC12/RpoP